MANLPPELQQLATHMDAQPAHVQVIFQYCLYLMMVQAGKVELIETTPSDSGPLCTFRTVAGDMFTLVKPQIRPEQEAALIEQLREILDGG